MSVAQPCMVGQHVVGDGQRPFLVAGPCVLEGLDMALRHAERLRALASAADFSFCFKSSFDKANRTSIRSFRGPGLQEGLRMLEEVRSQIGVPVLTDIHTPDQAAPVAQVVDVLQIPAFLCRQTDLLVAAAITGCAVNVKKGQFLAPANMESVVEKLRDAGGTNLMLTERGTTFGHGDLVVDFRGLRHMRALGHPVLFDVTHSTQRPGALGTQTGGDRSDGPVLARAAIAVGVDGLFLEAHENPDAALSDATTQLPIGEVGDLLVLLREIWRVTRSVDDESRS